MEQFLGGAQGPLLTFVFSGRNERSEEEEGVASIIHGVFVGEANDLPAPTIENRGG